MKTIDIDALQTVTGGSATSDYFCRKQVASKAAGFAGSDGQLHLDGARQLTGSLAGNGVHRCERDGLRQVIRGGSTTAPAKKYLRGYINSID